jgi:hypothetical protein
MTAVSDRIGTLEKNATSNTASVQNQIAVAQQQTLAILSRIDSKISVPPLQPLSLSPDEAQTVRNFFGVFKKGGTAKYGIGDIVGSTTDMPGDLVSKVPKLKEFAYDGTLAGQF